MKKIRIYAVLVVLFLIQTVIGTKIKIFGVFPNMVFTFSICYATYAKKFDAVILGFCSGFILDLTLSRVVGINGFIIMYLCFFVCDFRERFLYSGLRVSMMFTFVCTFIYQFAYFVLKFTIWGYKGFETAILSVIIPECIYNTIFSVFIYLVILRYLHNTSSEILSEK